MSRISISIISFLILLVIFIMAFSSSHTSRNMSNLAYVLAIGIDVGEKAKIKVSAQFSKAKAFSPSDGSSDASSNIVLVSGEADSIFGGLNLLNSYIGKEINLSHCNVVVFSEEFAKKGISSQIYSLMNNEEFRPTANLVISNCDAYDYLNNVKPNLEKLTVNYYDTFSITNKFTGYFSNITVGEFFNTISNTEYGGTAILGGLDASAREKEEKQSSENSTQNSNSENASESSDESSKSTETALSDVITDSNKLTAGSSSIEGKRGSENIGIAVFNKDKLCGKLTAIESICHLLIKNEIDSCIVSIDNPYPNNEEAKIEITLVPETKSKVDVKIENDIPHIYVKTNLQASILTLEDGINYDTKEVLNTFSNATKNYLEKEFSDYFSKISKDYGTDIDCFGNKALSNFTTIEEWKNFNWVEKFKNAEFHIDVSVNVTSSMLITKT